MTDKEKELAEVVYSAWAEADTGAPTSWPQWLAAAEAARAWRDPDAFQSGDEVEYLSPIHGHWQRAVFIGADLNNYTKSHIWLGSVSMCLTNKNIRHPSKTATRYKDLKETTAWLCDHGYSPDFSGDWWASDGQRFSATMLTDCGKPAVPGREWPAELLEEVEA